MMWVLSCFVARSGRDVHVRWITVARRTVWHFISRLTSRFHSEAAARILNYSFHVHTARHEPASSEFSDSRSIFCSSCSLPVVFSRNFLISSEFQFSIFFYRLFGTDGDHVLFFVKCCSLWNDILIFHAHLSRYVRRNNSKPTSLF